MQLNKKSREDLFFESLLTNEYEEYEYPDGSKFKGITVEKIDAKSKKKSSDYKKGRLLLPNGDIYLGEFMDNKYHGTGTLLYKTGAIYKGSFHNGWKDKGVMNYESSDYREFYDGQWSKDKNETYDGYGILREKNWQMYTGYFKNGKKEGRGTLHLPYGDDIDTIWENDVESITFNEGKRKASITITIFAHGADIDFMPDNKINPNVRILAAAGSCGMNYIQADRLVTSLVKEATKPEHFKPNLSTFENLENMQKKLYSVQYNKEITDKSNKYIIMCPVMEHIYALKDTSEYQHLRHITVVDIRNNTNTDIQVGMHLENIDIKNIFTPLISLSNNNIFKKLYYGPRDWVSHVRVINITSNKNITRAYKIVAQSDSDDAHLFLSLLLTLYILNHEESDVSNEIIKQLPDDNYNNEAVVDVMGRLQKYNKIINEEFYLTELLDFLQKHYEIINIVDMSCREINEPDSKYNNKEKTVSKSINKKLGGVKTRRNNKI